MYRYGNAFRLFACLASVGGMLFRVSGLLLLFNHSDKRPLTPKSMSPTNAEHAKLKDKAPNNKRRKERQKPELKLVIFLTL